MSKRGGTAPRPEKQESIFIPSRVPTSSSKYSVIQGPSAKISIRGSGYSSSNHKDPVYAINNMHQEIIRCTESRPSKAYESPLPEDIEHVWEEGTKRPKTQNAKSRRKSVNQDSAIENMHEVFPVRPSTGNHKLYEVPIIVIKESKNKISGNAKQNNLAKYGPRPSTIKQGKSLLSSLDQDFLDLFQM